MTANKHCYARLALKPIPLVDPQLLTDYDWGDQHSGYRIFHKEQLISDSVIATITETTGLAPDCYCVVFVNSASTNLANRWLHSDVVSVEDPRTIEDMITVQWRSASFGINFELFDIENHFYWFDVPEDVPRQQPNITLNKSFAWLHGVHFGPVRRRGGIPEGSREIENCNIGVVPTLVRTDIAHSTEFKIPQGIRRRIGVSLRFYQDISWNEAWTLFQPLMATG